MRIEEALSFIQEGEGTRVEFKAKIEPIARDVCAFLNTEGGTVLCGVSDTGGILGVPPQGATQRVSEVLQKITPAPMVQISRVRIGDRTIVAVQAKPSASLHSVGNVVYVRTGANNRPLDIPEVLERASENLFLLFDEQPSRADVKELDRRSVEAFLARRSEVRGVRTRGSLEENLRRLKITTQSRGREVPTWGGLLMFGRHPQRHLPQARISLVRFADATMQSYSDSREFTGRLPEVIDGVEQYLIDNLREIGGIPSGFKRRRLLEYPLEALREAVVNAVAHRNYLDQSDTKVFILPGQIRIKNPGAFPPGVTPDEPHHKPRNPLLASLLYDIGYVERYGYGITRMREACDAHPLVTVAIDTHGMRTELVFSQKAASIRLDEVERAILTFVGARPASAKDLTQHVGMSRQALNARIRRLMALNLLSREGAGRSTRYRTR